MQVYALTSNTEQAEVELFYDDLQDLLELTPKKDVLFNKELDMTEQLNNNKSQAKKIFQGQAADR